MRVECPAIDCQASGRFSEITKDHPLREKIPPEILSRVRAGAPILRCTYCGFTWGETAVVVPLGFLDSEFNPDTFKPVPVNLPVKRG